MKPIGTSLSVSTKNALERKGMSVTNGVKIGKKVVDQKIAK
jgi:hypothetical protein